MSQLGRLGTGIGWRPEIADAVERMPGIDWVEAVAENVCPGHLPESLLRLRERGVTVVPHGVSLGLGGADRPDEARLTALAERAEALGSPLVTEHIAFVRAGGPLTASPLLEAGHLLPVPRTRDALRRAVRERPHRAGRAARAARRGEHRRADLLAGRGDDRGPVPVRPGDRTGVRLLIDVANLHTNHVNRGEDPAEGARRAARRGHRVRPCRGRLRAGRRLARQPRPPGPAARSRHPHRPRVPGHPAGRPAGAGRELPRTGRAGAGVGGDPGGAGEGRRRAEPAEEASAAGDAARPPERPDPDVRPSAARPRRRPRCCPRSSRGPPCRRGSTGCGSGCRRGRSRRSGRTSWRRSRRSCRRSSARSYRPAFLAYAQGHPMTDGYRRDALDFAEHLLLDGASRTDARRPRRAARVVAGTLGPGPALPAPHGPAGPGHPPGAAAPLTGGALSPRATVRRINDVPPAHGALTPSRLSAVSGRCARQRSRSLIRRRHPSPRSRLRSYGSWRRARSNMPAPHPKRISVRCRNRRHHATMRPTATFGLFSGTGLIVAGLTATLVALVFPIWSYADRSGTGVDVLNAQTVSTPVRSAVGAGPGVRHQGPAGGAVGAARRPAGPGTRHHRRPYGRRAGI